MSTMNWRGSTEQCRICGGRIESDDEVEGFGNNMAHAECVEDERRERESTRRKNLRKEIRDVIKEVRISQEIDFNVKFQPDDDGSGGSFFIQDSDGKGLSGASLDEAMKYFALVLREMKSNSL